MTPDRHDLPRPSAAMVEAARRLRKNSTLSERLLWKVLKGRTFAGRKFRRQHPIGGFVLDFYCDENRLAIEIDGSVHVGREDHDRERQRSIESYGIRFLRLSARLVEEDMVAALSEIDRALLLPSPAHGRGAGGEGP